MFQKMKVYILVKVFIIFFYSGGVFSICLKPQLELLVTPPDAKLGNNVRIYWSFNTTYDGLWIALYSDQPNNSSAKSLASYKIQSNQLTGSITTGSYAVTDNKISSYDQPTYLGYTAVAWTVKGGVDQAIVSTRLQTYPQWMKHYWKFIKDVPICQLFLPGTHDTSSYKRGDPNEYSSSITAEAWKVLKTASLLNNWSLTQNRTIKEQLISGIRYLDIRVKRDKDFYWGCHADIIMHPLNQIIQQVVDFILNTEKEIVVFDLHELVSGIETDDEQGKFISYLKQSFTIKDKKLYVSPNQMKLLWKATPEMILAAGRVIITYPKFDYQKRNNMDILWPPVFQYWGDQQDINGLKDYIYKMIPTRNVRNDSLDKLTSVMAELTGNIKKIIEDTKHDISAQADQNSAEIHSWFLDPAVALQTNVLAVDFFTVSGVVRLAFIWNERKYYKSLCDSQETISDDYYQKILIS